MGAYVWWKAFHIIAVVCWFAGLFYLPRLFVYHAEAQDTVSHERFKVMERRLLYGITTPSAVLTVLLGLGLLSLQPGYYLHAHWMHAKLFLVLVLLGYHGLCIHYQRAFAKNDNRRTSFFYRCFNEIPVLFLVAIVILVVVKPF